MIYLFRKEVNGTFEQENFKRLQDYINTFPLAKGDFKFFEIPITGTLLTNVKWRHGLGYVPKDIIMTAFTNGATVTWNYGLFDRANLDITVSAETTIRAFVGRYEE